MTGQTEEGSRAAGPRVLHLLSGQEKGGIPRVVEALAAGPATHGGEAWIGVLSGRDGFIASGSRVVRFGGRGAFDPWAAKRLLGFARREAITIVHTHNVTANLYGWLLALVQPRLIHVIHVHGHFRQILLESQPSRLKRSLLLRGNALALRACDAVISNSNSVKEFLLEYVRDAEKVEVVYNGVDLSRVVEDARQPCPPLEAISMASDGARSGVEGGRPRRVGAFGRLAPVKNYPLFLEAARLVLADESDATFVIAGDGPDRAELERLAARLGIAQSVQFTGWLSNPYPLMAAMDAVVLTSLAEGFGLVLLEAMALQKPVIATAVGAVSELVRDGVTGTVVPLGDPAVLAGAIVQLLRDPSRGRAMGANGYERARTDFTQEAMCARTQQVYISAQDRRAEGRRTPDPGMTIRVVKLIFQAYLPFQGRFPRVSGQAKMLREAGHEVTILACDRNGTHPTHEVIDGIQVERIRVPTSEMRGPFRQVAPILVFYARAFRWLWRRPFHMLHCHNLDVLPLGYLVRKTKRSRLVFDAHEPNYYALWPHRLRFMVRILERIDLFFSKRSDAVSVTNHYQVQKYRRAGVRRVELIGNYPPPELRVETGGGQGARPYVFGRLGTFYPEVGLEETMTAFREVRARHPASRFLLAGRVVDNYEAQFRTTIEPLGDGVVWTGPYQASQMPELYRQIRVSCLIYPKTDWFRNITPRKFFDSMANGVPVLMTDIGGLGEVVREHRCGVVVDEKDIPSIVEAMERLIEDEALLDELSANALALARREYNWEAVSRKYVRLIEELHAS